MLVWYLKGITVTLLAWTTSRFTSSKSPTIKFLTASWKAAMAVDWKHTCTEGVPGPSGHTLYSWEISLINLWNGVFLIKHSVDCWYLLISLRATIPGWYQWDLLSPPVAGLSCLTSYCNRCFWGCFPPFMGNFLNICLEVVLLSGWTSLLGSL